MRFSAEWRMTICILNAAIHVGLFGSTHNRTTWLGQSNNVEFSACGLGSHAMMACGRACFFPVACRVRSFNLPRYARSV